jgi:hypothetical protein
MVKGRPSLLASLGAACVLAVGGLALSNPTPADFEGFAAGQLVQLVEQELCHRPALPLLLQLVIQNCPALVQAQSQTLGRLARDHSRRLNLGIASIYTTRFGGQQLLPNWRVPNYGVTTLAAAGHFVILSTSSRP